MSEELTSDEVAQVFREAGDALIDAMCDENQAAAVLINMACMKADDRSVRLAKICMSILLAIIAGKIPHVHVKFDAHPRS